MNGVIRLACVWVKAEWFGVYLIEEEWGLTALYKSQLHPLQPESFPERIIGSHLWVMIEHTLFGC